MSVQKEVYVGAYLSIKAKKCKIGEELWCARCDTKPKDHKTLFCCKCGTKMSSRSIIGWPLWHTLLPSEDDLCSPDDINGSTFICNRNNHGCNIKFDSDSGEMVISKHSIDSCLEAFEKHHAKSIKIIMECECVESVTLLFGVITYWR